jgi:hypothetical protein
LFRHFLYAASSLGYFNLHRRSARRTLGKTSEKKSALMMKKGTWGMTGMRTPMTPRMKKPMA